MSRKLFVHIYKSINFYKSRYFFCSSGNTYIRCLDNLSLFFCLAEQKLSAVTLYRLDIIIDVRNVTEFLIFVPVDGSYSYSLVEPLFFSFLVCHQNAPLSHQNGLGVIFLRSVHEGAAEEISFGLVGELKVPLVHRQLPTVAVILVE